MACTKVEKISIRWHFREDEKTLRWNATKNRDKTHSSNRRGEGGASSLSYIMAAASHDSKMATPMRRRGERSINFEDKGCNQFFNTAHVCRPTSVADKPAGRAGRRRQSRLSVIFKGHQRPSSNDADANNGFLYMVFDFNSNRLILKKKSRER